MREVELEPLTRRHFLFKIALSNGISEQRAAHRPNAF
jgi:hypothetical protein